VRQRTLSPRAVSTVPSQSAGGYFNSSKLGTDADQGLRQRPLTLHRLHEWQRSWTEIKGEHAPGARSVPVGTRSAAADDVAAGDVVVAIYLGGRSSSCSSRSLAGDDFNRQDRPPPPSFKMDNFHTAGQRGRSTARSRAPHKRNRGGGTRVTEAISRCTSILRGALAPAAHVERAFHVVLLRVGRETQCESTRGG